MGSWECGVRSVEDAGCGKFYLRIRYCSLGLKKILFDLAMKI